MRKNYYYITVMTNLNMEPIPLSSPGFFLLMTGGVFVGALYLVGE